MGFASPELGRLAREYQTRIKFLLEEGMTYEEIRQFLLGNTAIEDDYLLKTLSKIKVEDRLKLAEVITELERERQRSEESRNNNRANTLTGESVYRNEEIVVDESAESAWTHFREHLEEANFENITDIRESSRNILEMLKLKTEPGFPNKGAVMGNVQSGKTANMEALMSMACDNGWNVFIILSGVIDSLREQTENRMIKHLRKKQNGEDNLRYDWYVQPPLIGPKESVYFNFDLEEYGNKRYMSVILKNTKHLTKLLARLKKQNNNHLMNLIVIDDEADQASINTNTGEGRAHGHRQGVRRGLDEGASGNQE